MKQLLAKGNTLYATARNESKAAELSKVQGEVHVQYVDTADHASIKVLCGWHCAA